MKTNDGEGPQFLAGETPRQEAKRRGSEMSKWQNVRNSFVLTVMT